MKTENKFYAFLIMLLGASRFLTMLIVLVSQEKEKWIYLASLVDVFSMVILTVSPFMIIVNLKDLTTLIRISIIVIMLLTELISVKVPAVSLVYLICIIIYIWYSSKKNEGVSIIICACSAFIPFLVYSYSTITSFKVINSLLSSAILIFIGIKINSTNNNPKQTDNQKTIHWFYDEEK